MGVEARGYGAHMPHRQIATAKAALKVSRRVNSIFCSGSTLLATTSWFENAGRARLMRPSFSSKLTQARFAEIIRSAGAPNWICRAKAPLLASDIRTGGPSYAAACSAKTSSNASFKLAAAKITRGFCACSVTAMAAFKHNK